MGLINFTNNKIFVQKTTLITLITHQYVTQKRYLKEISLIITKLCLRSTETPSPANQCGQHIVYLNRYLVINLLIPTIISINFRLIKLT